MTWFRRERWLRGKRPEHPVAEQAGDAQEGVDRALRDFVEYAGGVYKEDLERSQRAQDRAFQTVGLMLAVLLPVAGLVAPHPTAVMLVVALTEGVLVVMGVTIAFRVASPSRTSHSAISISDLHGLGDELLRAASDANAAHRSPIEQRVADLVNFNGHTSHGGERSSPLREARSMAEWRNRRLLTLYTLLIMQLAGLVVLMVLARLGAH